MRVLCTGATGLVGYNFVQSASKAGCEVVAVCGRNELSGMGNVSVVHADLTDTDKLYRERERLVRAYEQHSAELKTFENNLGFFNAQSKSGNSMLREMQRRITSLKDDIAVLEQKIRLIDEKLS